MTMTREAVYSAVDSERRYQDEKWPRLEPLSVVGEITLLRKYLRNFEDHYHAEDDAFGRDVPMDCLYDLRKMAAILVRAMENSAAISR